MMSKRVVVTGLGMVTALGNDTPTSWKALVAGQSGVGPITKFDASNQDVRIAAEVRGFAGALYLDRKEIRRNAPFVHYAMAATRQALSDAEFSITDQNADDVGVIIGSGIGGLNACHEQFKILFDRGPDRGSPFFITQFITDIAAGHVSMVLGARGANFAPVSAWTADAYHITEPAPGGAGLARAMQRALVKGGIRAEEVEYINAHGTSTVYNDRNETAAIKTVFGDHAHKLGVSSTKSMLGHTLGAAGGIEAAITALAIHDNVMPPTINYEHADPTCDLDYVPNEARERKLSVALSNSMGFGGHNARLAFRRDHGPQTRRVGHQVGGHGAAADAARARGGEGGRPGTRR